MSFRNDVKNKIYNRLVNHDNGIRQSYHAIHDNASGRGARFMSYMQLAGMNMQYYLLGKRDFNGSGLTAVYEEKNLRYLSESAADKKIRSSVEEYVRKLEKYDVVSFDIFDTLLIRPFSDPTDVFFFIGAELQIPDFKQIRQEQEFLARRDHREKYGDNEVSFGEIWDRIERETGICASKGMDLELKYENEFCMANPVMKEVFNCLKKRGKSIICISDMYLSSKYIKKLLEDKGFTGVEKIYMSGEYKKSKAEGDIYPVVNKDMADRTWIHVGDNELSDVRKAEEAGVKAVLYPNIHKSAKPYRAFDMSSMVGSAYRGIVNDRIYGGLTRYTPEYEYGFIYGGIFVLGYATFIHDYCKKNGIERILFLSRDGEILKKVYDRLFPGEDTVYVYISRGVSARLMKSHDRYDYFRRFIDYKVNQKLSIAKVLKAMKLEKMVDILDETGEDMSPSREKGLSGSLKSAEMLTSDNAEHLKDFLIKKMSCIDELYRDEDEAALLYYSEFINDVSKVGVVDIGWTGSCGLAISYLAKNVWNISCEITGFVAGTNTPYCSQPDAGEAFLQQGCIVPYIFSQSLNRDIMKKHDPNKGYNVFWELLLSSPTRQFTGFEMVSKEDKRVKASDYKSEDDREQIIRRGDKYIRLTFGEHDANVKGAKRIQKGILDFVDDYTKAFKEYPFMFNISGRDAAAPMLLASSHKEKYLRAIAGRFDFKIDVN